MASSSNLTLNPTDSPGTPKKVTFEIKESEENTVHLKKSKIFLLEKKLPASEDKTVIQFKTQLNIFLRKLYDPINKNKKYLSSKKKFWLIKFLIRLKEEIKTPSLIKSDERKLILDAIKPLLIDLYPFIIIIELLAKSPYRGSRFSDLKIFLCKWNTRKAMYFSLALQILSKNPSHSVSYSSFNLNDAEEYLKNEKTFPFIKENLYHETSLRLLLKYPTHSILIAYELRKLKIIQRENFLTVIEITKEKKLKKPIPLHDEKTEEKPVPSSSSPQNASKTQSTIITDSEFAATIEQLQKKHQEQSTQNILKIINRNSILGKARLLTLYNEKETLSEEKTKIETDLVLSSAELTLFKERWDVISADKKKFVDLKTFIVQSVNNLIFSLTGETSESIKKLNAKKDLSQKTEEKKEEKKEQKIEKTLPETISATTQIKHETSNDSKLFKTKIKKLKKENKELRIKLKAAEERLKRNEAYSPEVYDATPVMTLKKFFTGRY